MYNVSAINNQLFLQQLQRTVYNISSDTLYIGDDLPKESKMLLNKWL